MLNYGIHMDNKYPVQADVVRKIEDHMAAKGISRKELKDSLSMSYEKFRKRMRSEIPFTLDELWTIATILKTSVLSIMPEDVAEPHSHAA